MTEKRCKGCDGHPHAADGEDPCPGYICADCWGSGVYAGSFTEYMESGGFEDWIREQAAARIAAQHDAIKRDLLSIPGVHEEMTAAQALALDLQIINQRSPLDGMTHYRGIAQAGAMLIDHHRDWGELRLNLPDMEVTS